MCFTCVSSETSHISWMATQRWWPPHNDSTALYPALSPILRVRITSYLKATSTVPSRNTRGIVPVIFAFFSTIFKWVLCTDSFLSEDASCTTLSIRNKMKILSFYFSITKKKKKNSYILLILYFSRYWSPLSFGSYPFLSIYINVEQLNLHINV